MFCIRGARGGQKTVLDPLKLEFMDSVSYYVMLESKRGSLQEQQVLLTSAPTVQAPREDIYNSLQQAKNLYQKFTF